MEEDGADEMPVTEPADGRFVVGLRRDVALRPLGSEHCRRMYAWMCDPVVSGNLGLRGEPSLEKTEEWVANASRDESIRPYAVLAGGQHVGNIVLDRIDRLVSTARLSVYVGEPAARGVGIGRTAIYLALLEAFGQLDLHKVWLTVHSRNQRAIRTYSGLGFAREGVLREEFCLDGQRVPLHYMGLLRDDFERISVGFQRVR
jgi:RimJ/RimL family protein N-acetyltransferase